MRTTLLQFVTSVLALLSVAHPAAAQYRDREHYRNDRYGYGSERYREDRETGEGDRQRNVAGEFDYYALVLSWSPTYCQEAQGDETQCNRSDGRRFNFVLHGLWPQYERGWPQDCRTARRPFVPQPLIDSMLDIMPSSRLVIHEYRKHGTCSGLAADAYFALARRLFQKIRIPEAYQNPFEPLTIEPRQLANDLMRANPGLKPENFAIACGGSGNRLKEVRFCFSKSGEARACGANEDQRRMCSASRMFVPPVRSTARGDDRAPTSRYDRSVPREMPERSNPLPAPRMDRYERGI